MSLTSTALKHITVTGKSYERADRDGLSIRVSALGKVTFQYRFRVHGKPYRMKLGCYPELSLQNARRLHAEARALVDQGSNPIDERREREEAERRAITVWQLCSKWIEDYARPNRARWQDLEQILIKDVRDTIGRIKLENLNRSDVFNKVLMPMVRRGSPVQANKMLTLLKQILSYGVAHGAIEQNPCENIKKQSVGGPERSRDRVLSDAEIYQMWSGLDKATMSCPIKIAIKLLLVTAQRRGELSRAKWEDVDLENAVWLIPAENSKNGKSHRVPLSPMAIRLFKELEDLGQSSVWVFPSFKKYTLEEEPLSEAAITRAVARWVKREADIEKFTPHDLRRTAVTKMNEGGTPPHVVEKIVNHTMGGVMAVYNRYEYWSERVEAMNNWADTLETLLNGTGKVTYLRANRRS